MQRDRRYTTQKEMITAECTRNITMAENQFKQQSAGSACAGRVHEPWVVLQALSGLRRCGSASTGARLRFVAFPINFLGGISGPGTVASVFAAGCLSFHNPQTARFISSAARRRDQALMALDQQQKQQGPPWCVFGADVQMCRRI